MVVLTLSLGALDGQTCADVGGKTLQLLSFRYQHV